METELESLKKRLEKLEKENGRLEKFNSDLQGQVKLSNAKLQLAKTYLYSTTETQTEVAIEPLEENDQVFSKSIMRKCLPNFDEQTKKCQDLKDMVEEMKQAHSMSDYHYDEKTKTYLSKSTGWYYYPECSAFFNPQDKCYYRYNEETKSYDFLSKLEEDGSKNGEPANEASDKDKEDCDYEDYEFSGPNKKACGVKESVKPYLSDEEENEDGELEDSDSETDEFRKFCSDSVGDFSKFNLAKQSQIALKKIPNVRMIVEKSETLEIGSLLVIGYNGGKLGNHQACSITIPDYGVSKLHTEIYYDFSENHYYVQHLSSKNPTFLNGECLNLLERRLLRHKDRLGIAGECEILVHIHANWDEICDGCEPGFIRKNIEAQEAKDKRALLFSNLNSSSSARDGLKSLKRKYGLEKDAGDGQTLAKLPSGYSDRAARRQKEKGSDNPYEKTGAGTALDLPIREGNKGFEMMKKMGWKKGQGVGAEKDKNMEPIGVEVRSSRAGLGFD